MYNEYKLNNKIKHTNKLYKLKAFHEKKKHICSENTKKKLK